MDRKRDVGRRHYFTDRINSPMGWDQVLAGASVLIISLVALALLFALADNCVL
ncbi:hypothetical protein [Streptomyces sp. NPDC056921]|uniref:hypothetical protein n=1 Tax=Streptomyces sp. NPDC056921 TaxID=3345966 RepID=UPI00362A8CA6